MKLTAEDWEDIADLLDDAAAGVEMKERKPAGMQTDNAIKWTVARLHAMAIQAQARARKKRKPTRPIAK